MTGGDTHHYTNEEIHENLYSVFVYLLFTKRKLDNPCKILTCTKHYKYHIPSGLVVRIPRSHRGGRGSIPRLGNHFWTSCDVQLSYSSFTFLYPATLKSSGYTLHSKNCVRVSVRSSVCPFVVCPSVRQRIVFTLWWEISTNFLRVDIGKECPGHADV